MTKKEVSTYVIAFFVNLLSVSLFYIEDQSLALFIYIILNTAVSISLIMNSKKYYFAILYNFLLLVIFQRLIFVGEYAILAYIPLIFVCFIIWSFSLFTDNVEENTGKKFPLIILYYFPFLFIVMSLAVLLTCLWPHMLF